MGYILGSLGFDLTVHDIYEAVEARYPDVVLNGLTDDLTIGISPPNSVEDTQETQEKCAEVLEFVAKESKAKAELELNFSKCHALAPFNIMDPAPGTLPDGTSLER